MFRHQLRSATARLALAAGLIVICLIACVKLLTIAIPPTADRFWFGIGVVSLSSLLLSGGWWLLLVSRRFAASEKQPGVDEAPGAEAGSSELALLLDITGSLNSTLKLDEQLLHLSDHLVGALGLDQFAVLLLEPDRRHLVVRTSVGGVAGGVGSTVPADEATWGEAIRTGRSVLQSPAALLNGPAPLDAGRRRFLTIPMSHQNAVVGVLCLSLPEERRCGPEEVGVFERLASLAAQAISNANLYERTLALSITDPLTGAYNRRYLHSQLEIELSRAERYGDEVTVIMIDLDHFKELNDSCGHTVGDEVLQEIASLLRSQVRRMDTVARFGGEEFAVILPRLRITESVDVAEKLRLAVQHHDFNGGSRQPGGRVTISLGTSTFPHDGSNLYALLNAADSALYASKRQGRNCTTAYLPGMEMHSDRKRQITEDGFRSSA